MDPRSFYIGWDLGGWNCDRNARSRDAIVILDRDGRIVGEAWRGNLRESGALVGPVPGIPEKEGWIWFPS